MRIESKKYILMCEECHEFLSDDKGEILHEMPEFGSLREDARKRGWHVVNGKDLCPQCYHDLFWRTIKDEQPPLNEVVLFSINKKRFLGIMDYKGNVSYSYTGEDANLYCCNIADGCTIYWMPIPEEVEVDKQIKAETNSSFDSRESKPE